MKDNHIKRIIKELEFKYPTKAELTLSIEQSEITTIVALRLLQVNLERSLHLGHMVMGGNFDYIALAVMAEHESRLALLDGAIKAPNMRYAGIGARDTPANVQSHETKIASRLEDLGFTLVSGKAVGSDDGFERGVKRPQNKEIYLPKKGFNGSTSPLFEIDDIARHVALLLHPNPDALLKSRFSFNAMSRNGYQILGPDLTRPIPVDFVCCFTFDGVEAAAKRTQESGGTGQAVMLADLFDIPVYNLANNDAMLRLTAHIESIKQYKETLPSSSILRP